VRPRSRNRRPPSRARRDGSMRVALGSDHAGFELKERLKHELVALGHEADDCGTWAAEPPSITLTSFPVVRGRPRRGGSRHRREAGSVRASRLTRSPACAPPVDERRNPRVSPGFTTTRMCSAGRAHRPARRRGPLRIWLDTGFEGDVRCAPEKICDYERATPVLGGTR
jgi:hypothetical protein